MKRSLGGILLAIALALGVIAAPARAGDTAQAMAGVNYQEVKGNLYSWCGFPGPCGVPTSAIILLEKQGPSEVILGDTFTYQIQISNRSAMDMIAVNLDDVLPENFEVQSIDPEPTSRDDSGKLFWNLGTIPAKTAKRISITGRPLKVGCMVTTSRAKICYEMPLPLAVRVVKCNVDVGMQLPDVVELCDPIPLKLTAYNVGSGVATTTVITNDLPAGLVTMDGKTSLNIPIGTLPVKGQKTIVVPLRALQPGVYSNTAVITADRDCTGEATDTVQVIAANLELAAAAPAEGYINTDIPYRIQVTNKGDAPARDVCVVQTIAGDFKITNISDGGKFDKKRVVWNIACLMPGESKTLCLNGISACEGPVMSTFTVSARCAEAKTAKHTLYLRGVAGVLTSVQDNCDPVQLGGTVTYTVTASNTGSSADTNLQYSVTLDEGMEYVSGSGTTPVVRASARELRFEPVPVLNKGQTAVWKITVRATGEGDKRFTAHLLSDQLQTPVSKSESTNFYEPNMQVVVAE